MKRYSPLLLTGCLALSLSVAGGAHATAGGAHARQATPVPPEDTVLIGNGQLEVSQGSTLGFTPKYLDITVGDTVRWKDSDALEPHTVSFGPVALLTRLLQRQFTPLPQKNGPPLLVFNATVLAPTPSSTYDGQGLANSGLLRMGQTWSLTFTTRGTYRYVCLIHGLAMDGYVIVHPRQTRGTLYQVQVGDGPRSLGDHANNTTNDAFYPQRLTVHVGDTVQWTGTFHTVSFGPPAVLAQLHKTLFIPMPQQSGPPAIALNPKAAFAAGGHTYNGSGFVNSGILVFSVPPGSRALPTYRLTFTKAGAYTYVCLLHPGMDGTVTVLPTGASS